MSTCSNKKSHMNVMKMLIWTVTLDAKYHVHKAAPEMENIVFSDKWTNLSLITDPFNDI